MKPPLHTHTAQPNPTQLEASISFVWGIEWFTNPRRPSTQLEAASVVPISRMQSLLHLNEDHSPMFFICLLGIYLQAKEYV